MSYKAEFLGRDIYDILMKDGNSRFNWLHDHYRRITAVPCGHCIECRLTYAMDWATRCMLEKKYYPEEECWFLTLTYDDDHLRSHTVVDEENGDIITGISLDKRDLRNFWKKVRYYYPDSKIKYIDCGEYGTHTNRPHNHAIVFGLPLPLNTLKFYKNNEMGDRLWSQIPSEKIEIPGKEPKYKTTPSLEQIWGKGFVTISRVTIETCAYVARYNLKKSIDQRAPNWAASQGKIDEFTSKSQGIGKRYFEEHWREIYETDTVPVKKDGNLMKPPLAYDRWLKEKDEELYYHIKAKRENQLITSIRMTYKHGFTPEEQRDIIRQTHERSIKNLRKDV